MPSTTIPMLTMDRSWQPPPPRAKPPRLRGRACDTGAVEARPRWPGLRAALPVHPCASGSTVAAAVVLPENSIGEEGEQRAGRQPGGRRDGQAADADTGQRLGVRRVERHLIESAGPEPGADPRRQVRGPAVPGPDDRGPGSAQGGRRPRGPLGVTP